MGHIPAGPQSGQGGSLVAALEDQFNPGGVQILATTDLVQTHACDTRRTGLRDAAAAVAHFRVNQSARKNLFNMKVFVLHQVDIL